MDKRKAPKTSEDAPRKKPRTSSRVSPSTTKVVAEHNAVKVPKDTEFKYASVAPRLATVTAPSKLQGVKEVTAKLEITLNFGKVAMKLDPVFIGKMNPDIAKELQFEVAFKYLTSMIVDEDKDKDGKDSKTKAPVSKDAEKSDAESGEESDTITVAAPAAESSKVKPRPKVKPGSKSKVKDATPTRRSGRIKDKADKVTPEAKKETMQKPAESESECGLPPISYQGTSRKLKEESKKRTKRLEEQKKQMPRFICGLRGS